MMITLIDYLIVSTIILFQFSIKMEFFKTITNTFTNNNGSTESPTTNTNPKCQKGQRKARIVDDELAVCTRENRENCFDPDSMRKAVKPLAIYAKIFGLFPRYDLNFNADLHEKKIKIIHILDYCYSGLLVMIMLGGGLMCTIRPPAAFERLGHGENDITDFYVSMASMYVTMITGIFALFTFPTANRKLLALMNHFSHLDKILRFDGRCEERAFVRRMLIYLVLILGLTFVAYLGFYILEPDGLGYGVCFSDYAMVPIMTICGTAILIPTALLIFFLHGLGIRLYHFNKFMEGKLSPLTPSSSECMGYSDYGLKEGKKEKDFLHFLNDFTEEMEKLRLLYTEMASISTEMSCLFGLHIVRDYIFSIFGLILYSYILIYVDYQGSVSNYVVVISLEGFLLLKLYILSHVAEKISCYGVKARKTLNKLSVSRMSSSCSLQVQMFLNALDNMPVRISASGYFIVDRSLLTSLLGAITTYFIILLQFKVGDVKNELLDLAKSCSLSNHSIMDEV